MWYILRQERHEDVDFLCKIVIKMQVFSDGLNDQYSMVVYRNTGTLTWTWFWALFFVLFKWWSGI